MCNKTFNKTFNKMLIICSDIYNCFSKNLLRARAYQRIHGRHLLFLHSGKIGYKRIHAGALSPDKADLSIFMSSSCSFPLLRFLPCLSCFFLACYSSIIATFNACIVTRRFASIAFLRHTPRFLDILKGNDVVATQNFVNFIVMS